MEDALFGALVAVIGTGAFAYLVHRENLRDQRLKERLDRIYEAQEAAYRAYDMTLHAVYLIFNEPGSYHDRAMLALPEIGRFLPLYRRLHIAEDEDLIDKMYDPVKALLDAAQQSDSRARDIQAPLVETGFQKVTDQLISLAQTTETERERGWFSTLLWKIKLLR